MRYTDSVSSVSWIPSEAITGLTLKLPFDLGVAHYDSAPPDVLVDLDALIAGDACRFANELRGWIDVEDGNIVGFGHSGHGRIGSTTLRLGHRGMTFAAVPLPDHQSAQQIDEKTVRFEQTAGGRTGVPAPRRVSYPPYVKLTAPIAWTTLALTLHADGSSEFELVGASPFPRHWIYDGTGTRRSKTAVIDFKEWSMHAFGAHTPWGDEESPALLSQVESALERQLSEQVMHSDGVRVIRLPAGEVLIEEGAEGDDVYLVLDGVLSVDVGGAAVAQVGPGAIVGERAGLEDGRRTATLTTVTHCTVAVADRTALDLNSLQTLSETHKRGEE